MRNGYENYAKDLHTVLDFLSGFTDEILEEKTDGSFYVFCIKLVNTAVKTIRFYHEFIEQQLIITLQIGDDFITTLELNKRISAMNEEDLIPKGDNYLDALHNNAIFIKNIVVGHR